MDHGIPSLSTALDGLRTAELQVEVGRQVAADGTVLSEVMDWGRERTTFLINVLVKTSNVEGVTWIPFLGQQGSECMEHVGVFRRC